MQALLATGLMLIAFGFLVFHIIPKSAAAQRFVRFCVVGTSNAVIDFGVLNLLLWRFPTGITWQILEYNSMAVILAATNSFFWNKYWTFKARNPITTREVSRFVVIASSTTFMNDFLIWLLNNFFPVGSNLWEANVLKLGAIVGTMSISFFGMQLWVFIHKQRRGEDKEQPLADFRPIKMRAVFYIDDHDTLVKPIIRTPSMYSPKGR